MSFELKFNFNHAWKFLRVSWLAFTGMQMWPWSPRSGVGHYPSLYHESWWFISWHIIPFLSISYYNSLQTIANLFTQPRDGMNLVAKEFVACRFVQLVPTINNIIIAIIFTSTKSYHPLMQDKRAWRSHSLPLCWCWWYDAWGPPRQPIWGSTIVSRHMTWHHTWVGSYEVGWCMKLFLSTMHLPIFGYASSSTLYPRQWFGEPVGHSFGLD